jgi:hypothetical protein
MNLKITEKGDRGKSQTIELDELQFIELVYSSVKKACNKTSLFKLLKRNHQDFGRMIVSNIFLDFCVRLKEKKNGNCKRNKN